jgi:hypothetical protein
MDFAVRASGKETFRYEAGSPAEPWRACRPCHAGQLCRAGLVAGGCLLVANVAPVLDYFSEIASHERVRVRYRENGYWACFEESGQRAAFVLLTWGMLHSTCPFFSRFAPLLAHYRVNLTGEMFLHLVLTTGLLDPPSRAAKARGGLQASLRRTRRDIEARLRPLLAEARRRQHKDAAVNAVTILYSCNTLATEGWAEYRRALVARLDPTGPEDSNSEAAFLPSRRRNQDACAVLPEVSLQAKAPA